MVHRYVEQMDKYYGNVCELDIIFNFQKAYFILDELLLAGEMQESSKKNVLRCISQQDSLEDMEVSAVYSVAATSCPVGHHLPHRPTKLSSHSVSRLCSFKTDSLTTIFRSKMRACRRRSSARTRPLHARPPYITAL